MRHITRRLRTLGRRLFHAARARVANVTTSLQQLDECATLGVHRLAEVVASLRRR